MTPKVVGLPKTVRKVVMFILSVAVMYQLFLLNLLKSTGTEEGKPRLSLIPCHIRTKPVLLLSPDEVRITEPDHFMCIDSIFLFVFVLFCFVFIFFCDP